MAIKIPPSSRTQEALDTPFEPNRNPGFGGVPSDIESTDVQNAIEEAKNDALSNDRYILLASYNGNANTGRYLEFFPGLDSSPSGAPILLPVSSRLLTIVAASSSIATGSIDFYNLTVSSTVPVYTVTFSGVQRVVLLTPISIPLALFPAGTLLGIKIGSGSINKPNIYFFLSAST